MMPTFPRHLHLTADELTGVGDRSAYFAHLAFATPPCRTGESVFWGCRGEIHAVEICGYGRGSEVSVAGHLGILVGKVGVWLRLWPRIDARGVWRWVFYV